MAYVNNCVAPPATDALAEWEKVKDKVLDPKVAYDLNFCYPVGELENDRVKLTPFVPAIHLKDWFQLSKDHGDLYRFMPFGPFDSEDAVGAWIEQRIHKDPGNVLFIILDKASKKIAGALGVLSTMRERMSTEIGFVMILPEFRRTHVTTNAVGLLFHWLLDDEKDGGLGLNRVQWQAHASNAPSVRAAERLGFRNEGTEKWQRGLVKGKEGREGVKERATFNGVGRDSVVLAICWDEWNDGGRQKVDGMMAYVKHSS
ncbi:acyl-CoA N-acyltransferase [Sistotremastrum suecicum HHB10207 ss-3]|uniref:Acyl-CoA N-acyltransferase n=1 Tax=Sistotremastrum suecicum HHB10207 ss-3 TaxID=1314776 RepID=A0A166B1J5_9AGAM|nr:acyl-CoA N-acyltransferase [Sistotremastrum suecicum HHB10207 ss-3]